MRRDQIVEIGQVLVSGAHQSHDIGHGAHGQHGLRQGHLCGPQIVIHRQLQAGRSVLRLTRAEYGGPTKRAAAWHNLPPGSPHQPLRTPRQI